MALKVPQYSLQLTMYSVQLQDQELKNSEKLYIQGVRLVLALII
ncbi:hypothetical protein [Natroniella sulfidigena]|nr:hypothetical protein [Natroniella sulfidigena]